MSTKSEILKEVPLFSLLDDQELGALAERVDEASFKKGEFIFHHGDPGDTMYVVRSGVVELWFKNDTGDRIVIETDRTGDFFGEISLLDGGPRTATAEVTEDVDVLVVDQGDLNEFLGARPAAALDLLAAAGKRLRESVRLLRHTATRNTNEEEQDRRTQVQRAADWIADFSGSIPFLAIHIIIFFVWIVLNVGPLGRLSFGNFDPFPFGLLTMVVSLEAIILSVFVLLSQNRQVARERFRNDIEYDVNLKAELQIAHMHVKVDEMNAEILAKLERLERSIKHPTADSNPKARTP